MLCVHDGNTNPGSEADIFHRRRSPRTVPGGYVEVGTSVSKQHAAFPSGVGDDYQLHDEHQPKQTVRIQLVDGDDAGSHAQSRR